MNPTYETSDFYLAAFLKAKGMTLQSHHRAAGGRVVFVFDNMDGCKELIRAYNLNTSIGVNDYKHALRDLKAMIYN